MILLTGLERGPEGQRGAQAHSDDTGVLAPPADIIQALVRNS